MTKAESNSNIFNICEDRLSSRCSVQLLYQAAYSTLRGLSTLAGLVSSLDYLLIYLPRY